MSRLRELMEELCPDGVEYKKLGDVVSVCRGVRVVRAELQLLGKYPVYQNSLIPMGYYDKENCIAGTAFIIGAGAAGDIGYSDVPFWAADDCFYFVCEDNMNARFLYYVLVGQETFIKGKVRKASIPRLSRNVVEKMIIPVPPLEIQNEIVKLLDNFTKLTAELTEQLMTELTLRKKQYNFYRDSLLNFVRVDDTIVQTDRQTDRQAQRISKFGLLRKTHHIEWKRLRDVSVRISSGGTPRKTNSAYYNGGTIPWLRTQEVEFNYIEKVSSFITEEGLRNSSAKWIPAYCVIVAISGATAGRSAVNNIPVTTNQHCCNIEVNEEMVEYKYVFYWVKSQYEKLKGLGRGARADLSAEIIANYPIPVPTLEVQQKIVSILDRFDALCNDLTSGLPAEIAARKKQYEHYRDKLLTFPRSKLKERS